jgi:hypothetical protein
MKSSLLLAALLALTSHSAHAFPAVGASAIRQAANQGDEESYRKYRAENAATLEEFLDWATPEEIAEDAGFSEDDLSIQELTETVADGDSFDVNIHVRLNSRRIDVSSPEGKFSAGALGGRPGYGTPKGCFKPGAIEKLHWSRKYNAPMPYSVFFKGGAALHAGSLSQQSHGCVHLGNDTAARIFRIVSAHRSSTRICVSAD